MDRALATIRVIDLTHVQSGPSCTQLLAWLGADVIKVERPGTGDITRGQLCDMPGADSLYFTMLNHNKRSLALDATSQVGKDVLERLIKVSDVLVENFAPGALDRMGFSWERINALNPRLILASIKGFGPGPYDQAKVYENVAQCIGGSASTTGFDDGPPLVTGAQVGDAGTGLNLAIGICAALYQRTHTGRGQHVACAMQDGVLNLCRIKLRDQQRMQRGALRDYPQFAAGKPFGAALPRIGNASGGGQPGAMLKCKGWEKDPNAYVYFIAQDAAWPRICKLIGEPGWETHPDFATHKARLERLDAVFLRIERWTMGCSKHDVAVDCTAAGIPCGPVMSMQDLADDPALRATGAIVEVDHPQRGRYLSVGNPIRMSDSPSEVTRSPLLGEHTEEILRDVLGFSPAEIAAALTATSPQRGDPLAAD